MTIFFNVVACQAQKVIPIEKEWEFLNSLPQGEDAPDGTYYKDTNHVLDKYVGMWKGSYKNKVYDIKVRKESREFLGVERDALLLNYEILNSSTKNSKGEIKGFGFTKDNNTIYEAYYAGKDAACGDSGTIFIDINKDKKTMSLYVLPSEALINDEKCPNGGIDPPFPDETQTPMVLTKQK